MTRFTGTRILNFEDILRTPNGRLERCVQHKVQQVSIFPLPRHLEIELPARVSTSMQVFRSHENASPAGSPPKHRNRSLVWPFPRHDPSLRAKSHGPRDCTVGCGIISDSPPKLAKSRGNSLQSWRLPSPHGNSRPSQTRLAQVTPIEKISRPKTSTLFQVSSSHRQRQDAGTSNPFPVLSLALDLSPTNFPSMQNPDA